MKQFTRIGSHLSVVIYFYTKLKKKENENKQLVVCV